MTSSDSKITTAGKAPIRDIENRLTVNGSTIKYQRCNQFSVALLSIVSILICAQCFGQSPRGADLSIHTPQDHGAVGDGKTDDTAAIQAALDSGKRIYLPAGAYRVTRSLRFDSGIVLFGDGSNSRIEGNFDGPILASRSYFTGAGAVPKGSTTIRDIALFGSNNPKFTHNHGILLRDFYSTLESIDIRSVGGFGVYLTDLRDDGSRASSGTLVENRIRDVSVRGSWKTSFFLGERGNRKFTDGYLYSCVSQSRNEIDSHLFVGSAGGWRIEDFHGYGKSTTAIGAEIVGAFRTKVRGIHLQNFRDVGMFLKSTQESVFIEGLSLDSDSNAAGAYGLRIGRNADYLPNVHIDGFSVTKDKGENQLTALFVGPKTSVSLTSEIALEGRASDKVTRYEVKGELRNSAHNAFQLSSSIDGDYSPGTYRKILGVVTENGEINDFVLVVSGMRYSGASEAGLEVSLVRISSKGEVSLLAETPMISQEVGAIFASTRASGPGIRAAIFSEDLKKVRAGDILVVDFTLSGAESEKITLDDAIAALTINAAEL